MQTLNEMVWLVPSMTPMALGTTPVVYQISRKERLQRKKYIGVCRLLLLHTRTMMDALPITVRVYIRANTTTKETRNSHVPEKPRRMNFSTLVPFAMSFQMSRSVCEERKVSVKICMLVLVLQMLQVAKKQLPSSKMQLVRSMGKWYLSCIKIFREILPLWNMIGQIDLTLKIRCTPTNEHLEKYFSDRAPPLQHGECGHFCEMKISLRKLWTTGWGTPAMGKAVTSWKRIA